MTTYKTAPFVLVGIDGSDAAAAALDWAAAEADRRSMALRILAVSDDIGVEYAPAATLAEGMSVFHRVDAATRDTLSAAEQLIARLPAL